MRSLEKKCFSFLKFAAIGAALTFFSTACSNDDDDDYRDSYTGNYTFTVVRTTVSNLTYVTDTVTYDGTIASYAKGDGADDLNDGDSSDDNADTRVTITFLDGVTVTPVMSTLGVFTTSTTTSYTFAGYVTLLGSCEFSVLGLSSVNYTKITGVKK